MPRWYPRVLAAPRLEYLGEPVRVPGPTLLHTAQAAIWLTGDLGVVSPLHGGAAIAALLGLVLLNILALRPDGSNLEAPPGQRGLTVKAEHVRDEGLAAGRVRAVGDGDRITRHGLQ